MVVSQHPGVWGPDPELVTSLPLREEALSCVVGDGCPSEYDPLGRSNHVKTDHTREGG